MAKTRMINTRFWNDNWVRDKLNPLDRLLFLYFLTNEHTNISGIYELPSSTISYETGIEKEELFKSMLPRLEPKIYYKNGWVILVNFLKHQNQRSPTVKKGIEAEISLIPNDILQFAIGYGYGIDTLSHLNLNLNLNSNYNVLVGFNPKKEEQLKEEITKNFMYYYDDIKTIRKNKYKHKIDIVQKSMLIKVGLLWIDLVSKRLGLKKEEVPVLDIYFPIRACWDRNPNWEYNDFKDLFIYFLNDKIKDEDKISFDLCLSEKYTAKFKINKKNKKITNASMAGEIKL